MIRLLLIVLCAFSANAAPWHIRLDATGTGDGLTWSNAFTSIPTTLSRANGTNVYYFADGTNAVSQYTFNTAESGTNMIIFRKATASEHGSDAGWSDSYGDGQYVFFQPSGGAHIMDVLKGYFMVDGVVGDGPVSGTKGFRFATGERNAAIMIKGPVEGGATLNRVILKNIEVDGWNSLKSAATLSYTLFYDFPCGVNNFLEQSNFVHHVCAGIGRLRWGDGATLVPWEKTPVTFRMTNVVVEYNDYFNIGGSSDPSNEVHWEVDWFTQIDGLHFRYNRLHNLFGARAGQTGMFMIGQVTNLFFAYNLITSDSGVFQHTKPLFVNIMLGTWEGKKQPVWGKVFNNTFAFTTKNQAEFFSTEAYLSYVDYHNNIMYGPQNFMRATDPPTIVTATGTRSYNAFGGGGDSYGSVAQAITSAIFNDYSALDLTLATQTDPGLDLSSLGAPYNTDRYGNVQGSEWSRGAFVYSTGGVGSVAPTFTTHPQSDSVANGSIVLFTSAATGTPTPTYQWYKNGSPITGATSATYGFAVALSDNGSTFYVVASNSAGTAQSHPAQLTVTLEGTALSGSVKVKPAERRR